MTELATSRGVRPVGMVQAWLTTKFVVLVSSMESSRGRAAVVSNVVTCWPPTGGWYRALGPSATSRERMLKSSRTVELEPKICRATALSPWQRSDIFSSTKGTSAPPLPRRKVPAWITCSFTSTSRAVLADQSRQIPSPNTLPTGCRED